MQLPELQEEKAGKELQPSRTNQHQASDYCQDTKDNHLLACCPDTAVRLGQDFSETCLNKQLIKMSTKAFSRTKAFISLNQHQRFNRQEANSKLIPNQTVIKMDNNLRRTLVDMMAMVTSEDSKKV